MTIPSLNLAEAKIAVLGLGYVGLPLAVEFAKHYPVVGFDIKKSRIEELATGRDNTLEVPPHELAKARHLHFTSDETKLTHCSVFIVTVPTPLDGTNRPKLTALIKASEAVGRVMSRGAIVIYEQNASTQATRNIV
jgi:UDP-N-acetyl-D-glucosamine/UDP-N-acetyl-D-galactosamine dehydrogenase